jgi:hypothetical protein
MERGVASQMLRLSEGDTLSSKEIMSLLHDRHCYPTDDLKYAQGISKFDVCLLRGHQINQVIDASLSEAEALKAARDNKAIAERIGSLLPTIFTFLNKRDQEALSYVVNCLFDLAEDFSNPPQDNRRVDKLRNDNLRVLANAIAAFEKASDALMKLDAEIGEFARELARFPHDPDASCNCGCHGEGRWQVHPDSLIWGLGAAAIAAKVLAWDLRSTDPRYPPKSFSMTKRDIVEFCELHYLFGGPPLRTTPGSDFTFLASLAFEAATGREEESLAGAVIDFARSHGRKAEDEYRREESYAEAAFQSGDNFYLQRRRKFEDEKDAAWYRNAAEAFTDDEATRTALLRVAENFENSANSRELQFGPFIVWAENMPNWRDGTILRESEERQNELRQLRRRLGELRRQAAAFGLGEID